MATPPPCKILDEEELEKSQFFREWREDKEEITAARIFGGPGHSYKKHHFPTAFQSYKPDRESQRVFPFRNTGAAAGSQKKAAAQARPAAAVGAKEDHGLLVSTVLQSFTPNSTIQGILEHGIQLLPLEMPAELK